MGIIFAFVMGFKTLGNLSCLEFYAKAERFCEIWGGWQMQLVGINLIYRPIESKISSAFQAAHSDAPGPAGKKGHWKLSLLTLFQQPAK